MCIKVLYLVSHHSLEHKHLFLGYAVLVLVLLITSVVFSPAKAYHPKPEGASTSSHLPPLILCLAPPATTYGTKIVEAPPAPTTPPRFRDQLCTWAWFLHMIFMLVNLFGMQYYIGSGADQLQYIGDDGNSLLFRPQS